MSTFDKQARTLYANRALVLSELFTTKFRDRRFSGAVTRTLRVNPPDTESTGGGKMARETISLVPEVSGVDATTVVCGWIDVKTNTAELRSYTALAQRHRQRYGDGLKFDLKKDEYDAFLKDAQRFLADEGIATTLIEDSPPIDETSSPGQGAPSSSGRAVGARAEDSGSSSLVFIAVAIGLAVGAIGAYFFLK